MSYLDCPSPHVWEERRAWFESQEEEYRGQGNYFVGEQACALLAEVQSAFCAGAWATVIIVALAVIDAQLRETEVADFKGSTEKLLVEAGVNPKVQRLRRRRNALIHVDPDNPAITVDQQLSNRNQLELEAREAVTLMFEAFYVGPWL
ncbi:MAG: hypothetical protein ABIH46_13700 [Chloroflexota bacterium]